MRQLKYTSLIFFISFFYFKASADFSYTHCASINQHQICGTPQMIGFSSDHVKWVVSHDEFVEQLKKIWTAENPDFLPQQAHLFLWVDDFNNMIAFRVQFFGDTISKIVDLPADYNQWMASAIWRQAGSRPYPIDYGYAKNEYILSCVTEACSDSFLTAIKNMSESMVLVSANEFVVQIAPDKIQDWKNFQEQFKNEIKMILPSPIFEGNGQRLFVMSFQL